MFIKKIIGIALICCGFSLFATEGTITYLKGKVEVQRNNEWIPLKMGDTVYSTEVISTGFQSEAKIKVMDSVLSLGPVTRISLKELSSTQDKDKINVYLNTGTLRTKVNHTDNKRVSCQVRTPIGVASVRGTEFDIDDSNIVSVIQGIVAVISNLELESLPNNPNTGNSAADDFENSDEISDFGVLVHANQNVQMSSSNSISKPQSNIQTSISNIISQVSTNSNKESVFASEDTSENIQNSDVSNPVNPPKSTTSSVIVDITLE